MKKLGKKLAAGMLSFLMCASVVTAQAAGEHETGGDIGYMESVSTQAQTDAALANSKGFGYHQAIELNPDVGGRMMAGVNTFSGNLFLHQELSGGVMLSYNSLDSRDYGFGRGFASNLTMRVIDNHDETYSLVDETGTEYLFRLEGYSNAYIHNRDVKNRDLMIPRQYTHYQYELTDEDQQKTYYFNGDGTLQTILDFADGYDSYTNFQYKDDGKLSSIEADKLRYEIYYIGDYIAFIGVYPYNSSSPSFVLNFRYDNNNDTNILRSIDIKGDALVNFSYNENGEIVSANEGTFHYITDTVGKIASYTNLAGDTWTYLYGNLQTMVMQPDGQYTLMTFNENGEVIP